MSVTDNVPATARPDTNRNDADDRAWLDAQFAAIAGVTPGVGAVDARAAKRNADVAKLAHPRAGVPGCVRLRQVRGARRPRCARRHPARGPSPRVDRPFRAGSGGRVLLDTMGTRRDAPPLRRLRSARHLLRCLCAAMPGARLCTAQAPAQECGQGIGRYRPCLRWGGAGLDDARSDARYCSPACRQKAAPGPVEPAR